MDLRQLTYFVRVVDMKSFTKAADVLHIAQPAIGFQIRKLEDELQAQLLNRHSRGVEPTEAGLMLLEKAREILEAANAAKLAVRDLGGPERGLVELGVPPGHPLAVEVIVRARREFPQIALNIVEDVADKIIEHVRERRLQLGCIFTDINRVLDVPGLCFDPLLEDRLCLIGSPEAMGDERGPITFAEVAAHPLILSRESAGMRRRMDRVAESLGITLDVAFQIHSEPLVSSLLDEGIGFAIKPSALARHRTARNQLVAREIVEPELRSRLYLVSADKGPLSKATNAIRSLIQAAAKEEETVRVQRAG